MPTFEVLDRLSYNGKPYAPGNVLDLPTEVGQVLTENKIVKPAPATKAAEKPAEKPTEKTAEKTAEKPAK